MIDMAQADASLYSCSIVRHPNLKPWSTRLTIWARNNGYKHYQDVIIDSDDDIKMLGSARDTNNPLNFTGI